MDPSRAGAATRAPLPLRPMLLITDRLDSGVRLFVLVVVLLVPGLLAHGSADGVYLALVAAGVILAGWFALAMSWRARWDTDRVVAAVDALAEGSALEWPAPSGHGEFGDIARRVDAVRRILAGRQDDLLTAHAQRERELQRSYERQSAAQAQVRQRAQAIIDETAAAVILELQGLIMQVDSVRSAAGAIEERVTASDVLTRGVVGQARTADAGVVNLSQSLRSVADTAQLIRGVAEQTKLLALNATIEAARAGAAGRGFSVVADEVKTLAVATALSTQQITATIAALENDASEVAAAISDVGGGMTSLDEATLALKSVAENQYAVVAQLDSALAATVERVEAMATLNERLERRHAERRPITGTVEVRTSAGSATIDLLDLSLTGVRCVRPSELRIEQDQRVRLRVRVDGTEFSVAAVVIRSEDGSVPADLGMAFDRVDTATLATLRRLTAAG